MLIRFSVRNLYSFQEEVEFNTLTSKLKRLPHHKYLCNNVEALKLSAIYGANGSGKSNLITALYYLKHLAGSGKIPLPLTTQQFRLSNEARNLPVELAIEFCTAGQIFYYAVSIQARAIAEEYLSKVSGGEDEMVFHRHLTHERTIVDYNQTFDNSVGAEILKSVIIDSLLLPNKSLLHILATDIKNEHFSVVRTAMDWLMHDLTIILPTTQPNGLEHRLEAYPEFAEYSKQLLRSLNTGVSSLFTTQIQLEDAYDGEELEQIKETIAGFAEDYEGKRLVMKSYLDDEDICITKVHGKYMVSQLRLIHQGRESAEFKLEEESDGTRRLIEYLPMFSSLGTTEKTFVIDEIERSIHPLIIRELVKKFSEDETTKGQLIFTTHETSLLNQDFLRTDEIWFAEKNPEGASTLYSLSDFKEHNTIDIQKGYLSGRYGGIPFLGDLKQLNWHQGNEAE